MKKLLVIFSVAGAVLAGHPTSSAAQAVHGICIGLLLAMAWPRKPKFMPFMPLSPD